MTLQRYGFHRTISIENKEFFFKKLFQNKLAIKSQKTVI